MCQLPYYKGNRRRQTERAREIFAEIRAKNFPKMGKESLTQIQEAQRVPYKINPRRNTLRHILKQTDQNERQRENLESS